MFEGFLTSFGAAVSFEAAKSAFQYVARNHPDLAAKLNQAEAEKDTKEIEQVFEEAVGIIAAEAKAGEISIDEATLTALRRVKFDHQHGIVTISNSSFEAPILLTGGGHGATGATKISGNTSLKSKGTEIKITGNASILIKGNASIKQT